MAGAGRILKNALAVAASAACLSRSRRSRVALAVAAGRRTDKDSTATDQDSTATDSDSDFLGYNFAQPIAVFIRSFLRRNG